MVITKRRLAVAVVALATTLATTQAGNGAVQASEPAPAGIQPASTTVSAAQDGRALFTGVFFLSGPAGDRVVEALQVPDGMVEANRTAEAAAYIEAAVTRVGELDAGFFAQFSESLHSGDPFVVENALDSGAELLRQVNEDSAPRRTSWHPAVPTRRRTRSPCSWSRSPSWWRRWSVSPWAATSRWRPRFTALPHWWVTFSMFNGIAGQMARAAAHFAQALALSEQTGRVGAQATSRSKLAVVEMELGRLREAAGHHAEALALYRKLGSVDGEAMTLLNLGLVHQELGDLDLAERHLREASDRRQQVGDRVLHAHVLDGLARVRRDTGDLAAARRHADAALAAIAGGADRRYEGTLLNTLASIELLAGELAQAADGYRRALEVARRLGVGLPEIEALIGLAACRDRLGDQPAAERLARDALARARAAGSRILEGRALTVLAEVCWGRDDEAERNARAALDSHRETGYRLGEAATLALLARL